MKHLLKKEKLREMYDRLFERGCVECGHEGVENFIDELGEMLHHNSRFKKIKDALKSNASFQQRFEAEIKRIVLEGSS